eukprot:GEMP01028738.1.p1 GENE.GEMP01028738.1~~GEMP01028738.1.p1  ORF type:complete len:206 (+),score=50.13 GEMP01028738.1:52-669(+)
MGIMEYNGSAVLAMTGKNCVAIAADRRYGVRQLQTMSCDFQKIFPVTERAYVGLAGLATDVQTMAQLIKFRTKLYALKEERQMKPKTLMNMIATTLYERRFGPYLVAPVVAGLDADNNPHICAYDFIGALSLAEDFVVSGTTSEQLYGVCESFYRPDMNPDELFETVSQCLLAATDRDCLAGWGGIVHVITPEGVTTKTLKGRMD